VVWVGAGPGRHRRRIDRSYAIASKEVTLEQFLKCRKGHKGYFQARDGPVDSVTWYEAAAYCNWLSKREGIPKEQWCYEPNEKGEYAEGMKLAPGCLRRAGYRLPTEWEWEYACRAGADTAFSFGEAEEILVKYAWHLHNSFGRPQPVGLLKPNDLGLFDMHGNVWELTLSTRRDNRFNGDRERDWESKRLEDQVYILSITKQDPRVTRGGGWERQAEHLRFFIHTESLPYRGFITAGFRPARTLPAE
jgi:formylglycine-generating enzyme required for sulfatase activity